MRLLSDVVFEEKQVSLQSLSCLTAAPCSPVPPPPSATYPAAYSLVGQPFPHQPQLVAQQPQQPQQLQQREGNLKGPCTNSHILGKHSSGCVFAHSPHVTHALLMSQITNLGMCWFSFRVLGDMKMY